MPEHKTRLIATSWSINPIKGGPAYTWMKDNLDWDRFEFTFVGRCSEPLEKARHVRPLDSRRLADELRRHNVYVTASTHDPCSNALIEALNSGLPAIYLNSGGHSELARVGLNFDSAEEISDLLDRMVDDYTGFQDWINVPDIDDLAGKYMALMFLEEPSVSGP
jgi:hypothetical protein